MPHKPIDLSRRADVTQLTEWMDEPCSREVMRACLIDLARLNRWFLGYRPTLSWLDGLYLMGRSQPVRILDIGCGYGDTLREIERWARRRGIGVELIGLDLNADTVAIAADATPAKSGIRWIQGNVFHYTSEQPVHLVISSLFTHHLSDADIVQFLRWMEEHAALGWFINDLSRAPIPYHLLDWFSRVMWLHPYVQHDGPVSIARAFQPQDWRKLCSEAGLSEREYEIRAYTPARLCVGRRRS